MSPSGRLRSVNFERKAMKIDVPSCSSGDIPSRISSTCFRCLRDFFGSVASDSDSIVVAGSLFSGAVRRFFFRGRDGPGEGGRVGGAEGGGEPETETE